MNCYFTVALQLKTGHGLLILEVSISHSDTPHSVGLLWTSDQVVAETSTWQYTTLTSDRHQCPLQDSNAQTQGAGGRRPARGHREHGYWELLFTKESSQKKRGDWFEPVLNRLYGHHFPVLSLHLLICTSSTKLFLGKKNIWDTFAPLHPPPPQKNYAYANGCKIF